MYVMGSYRGNGGDGRGWAWFDAECGRNQPIAQRGHAPLMADPPAFPADPLPPAVRPGADRHPSPTGRRNTLMVGEYATVRRSTAARSGRTRIRRSALVRGLSLPAQSRQPLATDYDRASPSAVVGSGATRVKRGGSFQQSHQLRDGRRVGPHISTNIDRNKLAAMATIANNEVGSASSVATSRPTRAAAAPGQFSRCDMTTVLRFLVRRAGACRAGVRVRRVQGRSGVRRRDPRRQAAAERLGDVHAGGTKDRPDPGPTAAGRTDASGKFTLAIDPNGRGPWSASTGCRSTRGRRQGRPRRRRPDPEGEGAGGVQHQVHARVRRPGRRDGQGEFRPEYEVDR